jgi:predicted RNase H-like nuclease (RuvC/YqgF family)
VDLFNNLATAITIGAALGATIAGLITWRKTAHDKLQTAIIGDYEKRTEQLEKDKADLGEENAALKKRVESLENEKRLPLERMTKLIVKQHNEQMASTNTLTKSIGTVVDKLTQVVDALPSKGKS